MTIKTIFLDRDGVINKDIGYLHKIDEFEFIDGIFEICDYLSHMDYKIIIITNQSGIARGYFNSSDYYKITNWMLMQFSEHGINILDIFHCPHSDDSNCNCRKPKPGMFIEAKNKHNINMQASWNIGDSERDIIAASSAGINNTILLSSNKKTEKNHSKAKYFLQSIKDIKSVINF